MTKQLILIHGRAQQELDPDDLKKLWIETLKAGLDKNGLDLPIDESDIRFPYFGDTLANLVDGVPADEIAEVIVKGEFAGEQERNFVRSVFLELQHLAGVSDEQVELMSGESVAVNERGIANWVWVQRVLKAIDQYVPYASSTAIALATRDVYLYLKNPGFQNVIDSGVRSAFDSGRESVVVGHSLGSVVGYRLLRQGDGLGWKIPAYITVGSPLAITAIKEALDPCDRPACVGDWFNAMDERDVVALYPLDSHHFHNAQPIQNKTDVDNQTPNRHGIAGYLSDPVVAKKIYDALIG